VCLIHERRRSAASRWNDHAKATAGVECRKAADVIDETPIAYKSIDAVMEKQRDVLDVVHTLRQVVCVKG
jgi:tRNA-splicing ligase RtcB